MRRNGFTHDMIQVRSRVIQVARAAREHTSHRLIGCKFVATQMRMSSSYRSMLCSKGEKANSKIEIIRFVAVYLGIYYLYIQSLNVSAGNTWQASLLFYSILSHDNTEYRKNARENQNPL